MLKIWMYSQQFIPSEKNKKFAKKIIVCYSNIRGLNDLFKIENKFMLNKLIQYIKDSKRELKKVVWPTKKEVQNHTLLVIAFSLVVAFFLGMVDFGLTELVSYILK